MSTPSPALAEAGHLLHDDLYEHLHEAEALSRQKNEWSADDQRTARTLIGDLVLVLRGLLIEHRAHSSGECRLCISAWPCPVVKTIHATVKDPEREFIALVTRARGDE